MSNALAKLATEIGETKKLPTIYPEQLREKWVLKKLSQKHKSIVALHIQGMSRNDIGRLCNCTPEYVSMIVAQPLAKEYISTLEEYMDSRLRTSYGKAVEVIHDVMDSQNDEHRLKAARLALEATGKLKGGVEKEKSAEDVVAAILARASTVIIGNNVQVNTGE